MSATQPRAVLERGAKRTAEIEIGPTGERFFVKRFHAPGLIDRHLDERRARRELASLARLRELSIPAPEPVEVRQREGRFELVTHWIERSAPLATVLAGDAGAFGTHERLARSVGELLASLHEHGVEHPDLYAGNALALAGGGVALVDAHGLRFRTRAAPARCVEDLVTACADVRELVGPRFRARAFVAWWRALSPEVRRELPDRSALAEDIERRARERRRSSIERSRLRWTRASSVAEPFEEGGARGWASRLFTAAERRIARYGARALLHRFAVRTQMTANREPVKKGSGTVPRDSWCAAVRLFEHGIATALPLLFLERPERAFYFALPLDARARRFARSDRRTRARMAAALGHLCGSLADRGLALERGSIVFDGAERAIVDAGARITACDALDLRRALLPVAEHRACASRIERTRFAVAFLRAWCGTARERALVRARLLSG